MKSHPHPLLRSCSALFLAACLSPALPAQTDNALPTPTPAPTSVEGGLAHADRSFLRKASSAGTKEIIVSQSVLDRLSDPQLKAFAQQMVTDHTAANSELAALAGQKGLQLPVNDDGALANEWSKMTGDVDRKYVELMVADHEEAVKLFGKATQSRDPDIAAWAQKTLPKLQHHLSMALDLKSRIN